MSVATNGLKHAEADVDIYSLPVEEGVKWAAGLLKEYTEKLADLQEKITTTSESLDLGVQPAFHHYRRMAIYISMYDTIRKFVSPVRGYTSGLLDFVELAHEVKTELQLRLYEYEERIRFLDDSMKFIKRNRTMNWWKEVEKAIEATGRPYPLEK